jgi:DNA (cytosine-5)-methyltransferase 1
VKEKFVGIVKTISPQKVKKKRKKKPSQKELIDLSIESGISLDKLLEENGISYKDLNYVVDSQIPLQFSNVNYKTLDDFVQPYHGVPTVSFFSGCGGLDLGFEAAGFEHLALVENNRISCNTLRANRDWTVLGPPSSLGDVSQKESLEEELKSIGVKEKFEGIFTGGPPCQPFSIAANQRFSKNGKNFKRVGFGHAKNGNLLFDFVSLLCKFQPRAFLIENVSGLIDLDGGKQVKKAYEILKNSGYLIHSPLRINAANYSVPQQRNRIFIIGYRGDKQFIPPQESKEIIPCSKALIDIKQNSRNHITRKHKANSVARYVNLGFGKRDKLGRVDRLDPLLPSKTVIAGGASGGGRSHLHPFIPRTLSVRECARLQTFPDHYYFTGPSARQFTQVGNAVPPVLAAQLANAIFTSYFKS